MSNFCDAAIWKWLLNLQSMKILELAMLIRPGGVVWRLFSSNCQNSYSSVQGYQSHLIVRHLENSRDICHRLVISICRQLFDISRKTAQLYSYAWIPISISSLSPFLASTSNIERSLPYVRFHAYLIAPAELCGLMACFFCLLAFQP